MEEIKGNIEKTVEHVFLIKESGSLDGQWWRRVEEAAAGGGNAVFLTDFATENSLNISEIVEIKPLWWWRNATETVFIWTDESLTKVSISSSPFSVSSLSGEISDFQTGFVFATDENGEIVWGTRLQSWELNKGGVTSLTANYKLNVADREYQIPIQPSSDILNQRKDFDQLLQTWAEENEQRIKEIGLNLKDKSSFFNGDPLVQHETRVMTKTEVINGPITWLFPFEGGRPTAYILDSVLKIIPLKPDLEGDQWIVTVPTSWADEMNGANPILIITGGEMKSGWWWIQVIDAIKQKGIAFDRQRIENLI